MGVLADTVVVEETKGAGIGRSRETRQKRIEVFDDLPPKVVDRAVAFVHDDEVEELRRDSRVILDRAGITGVRGLAVIFLRLVQRLAGKDRIHPLDR